MLNLNWLKNTNYVKNFGALYQDFKYLIESGLYLYVNVEIYICLSFTLVVTILIRNQHEEFYPGCLLPLNLEHTHAIIIQMLPIIKPTNAALG